AQILETVWAGSDRAAAMTTGVITNHTVGLGETCHLRVPHFLCSAQGVAQNQGRSQRITFHADAEHAPFGIQGAGADRHWPSPCLAAAIGKPIISSSTSWVNPGTRSISCKPSGVQARVAISVYTRLAQARPVKG